MITNKITDRITYKITDMTSKLQMLIIFATVVHLRPTIFPKNASNCLNFVFKDQILKSLINFFFATIFCFFFFLFFIKRQAIRIRSIGNHHQANLTILQFDNQAIFTQTEFEQAETKAMNIRHNTIRQAQTEYNTKKKTMTEDQKE